MAKEPRQGQERSVTPPDRIMEGTPQTYHSAEYSFLLQATFEIQKSIGQLQTAIATLTDETRKQGERLDKQSEKISKIEKDIHTAKVAGAVLGAIGAFLGVIGKMAWDYFVTHPPTKTP